MAWHFHPTTSSIKCYQCDGILCTSLDLFEKVDCPEMCFVISLFGTTVYRGCYAQGGYMVNYCNRYRTSRCHVCVGFLCNSMIFWGKHITCRICPRGLCTEKTAELSFYQACPRFRFPEVMHCFTIVDPWTMEYTFGCGNEMTLEQHELCEKDYTGAVCRICDTPNCNNKFFYPKRKNLECFVGDGTKTVTCENIGNSFPYYGCYQNTTGNKNQFGCYNTLFESSSDPRYEQLWTGDRSTSLEVCTEDRCNKNRDDRKEEGSIR